MLLDPLCRGVWWRLGKVPKGGRGFFCTYGQYLSSVSTQLKCFPLCAPVYSEESLIFFANFREFFIKQRNQITSSPKSAHYSLSCCNERCLSYYQIYHDLWVWSCVGMSKLCLWGYVYVGLKDHICDWKPYKCW